MINVLHHTCGVNVGSAHDGLEHEWLEEDAHEGITEGGEDGHVAACDVVGPSMAPTLVDDTSGVLHASGQHP